MKDLKFGASIAFFFLLIVIFGLFAPGASADTNISNCTDISSPGSYYLNTSISNSPDIACINISANNVTLDCQGNTIDGDGEYLGPWRYGVLVSRAGGPTNNTNVTIKNCIISDWDYGIDLYYASNNTIRGVNVSSNSYGIRLKFNSNNTLLNITAVDNYGGLILEYSSANAIINSSLVNNINYDFYMMNSRPSGASECKQIFSNVNGTDNKPIIFYNSSVNLQSWNNNISELVLCNASNSVVNNFVMNHTNGDVNMIQVVGSRNVTISNTNISHSFTGIWFYNSSNNLVANFSATGLNDGISITDFSYSNNVTGSRLINNDVYGISFDDNNNFSLFYNNFFNNTDNVNNFYNTTNYWNTTLADGTNIIGESKIGGNFWANPSGSGFSQTCNDLDGNGICDSPYNLTTNNKDYLALVSSIDSTPPTSYLTLPVGGAIFSVNNVTFNCSAVDNVNLSNITLYGNWTGWHANETVNVFGLSNSTNFSRNFSEGDYTWNCYVCDKSDNCAFNATNKTFVVDTSAPEYLTYNAINGTYAGYPILYYTTWQDNYSGLSGYIFSFDNCTGTLANDSWAPLSGGYNPAYSVKVTNSTVGCTIRWQVYVNDSAGHWNSTPINSYNTTALVLIPSFGTNPVDNYDDNDGSIVFDMKCSDSISISTIQLWGNWSGTWQVNQTNSSPYNDTWWNVTVTGISDGSNYKWAVWCNNTVGLTNITINRTFNVNDTTGPTITHNSPANDSYYNRAPYFYGTCTDTGSGISKIWANSTKYPSVDTTSPYNFTNFSSLTNGVVYSILIYCNDTKNNTATSMFYFTYDTDKPAITLDGPANDYSTTSTSRDFTYKVEDVYGIKNCSLYVDGDIEHTDTSGIHYDGSTVNTFADISLSRDEHTWQIKCYDLAGNLGTSPERTLTVTSSSSNGGGGSSSDDETVVDENKTVNSGNLTNLSYSKTIPGLSRWDKIIFMFQNTNHTLTMKEVTTTSATMEVNSTPVTFTLNIDQIKDLDLNGNGMNDFSIKLVSITSSEAKLLLKPILEVASSGGNLTNGGNLTANNTAFKGPSFKLNLEPWKIIVIILVVIVIVLMFVIISIYDKKKKKKFWKKGK